MIKILCKQVADKIAAGEVVDRPLSIVKELVENSVDAGASAITVEMKKGGKELLRITDNGCGIPREETEIAFQRHATSKISEASDLEAIETLGFRGEALASIAAVTRTELITRTAGEKTGTKLVIEGGQVVEKTAVGCPDGTTVVVRDLFYNTPARLKFMRSDSVESSLIIEFVSQMALAYAEIKFRLINNGVTLFTTTGKGDIHKNILTVYSREIGDGLIPVEGSSETLQIKGYISGPGLSRPNRKRQIFFINGRVIQSKVIEKGIARAYSDKLFEGRFPIAFLFLQTLPERLDVNIHPNKREVRFYDETFITEFVADTLRHALLSKEAIPEVKENTLFQMDPPSPQQKNIAANPQKKVGSTQESSRNRSEQKQCSSQKKKVRVEEQVDIKKVLETIRKEQQSQMQIAEPALVQLEEAPQNTGQNEELLSGSRQEPVSSDKSGLHESSGTEFADAIKKEPETISSPPPFNFDELTVTGSVFQTYITAADQEHFYFIDQHAAHERIIYEELVKQYKRQEKSRQTILIPIILNVPYDIKENQYGWLDALNDMGFSIELFGPKTYAVKEIPVFLELQEAEQFLTDFIENISENTKLEQFPTLDHVITSACKRAVKAHDRLSDDEMDALLNQLKQCENPFSCPHGRPTFVKISQHKIEKMFKRV